MKNDWLWDRKLHIHTRGDDRSKEDRDRYAYEPTPYGVLLKLVDSGWVRREDVLMDYGCGKGRVGLFMHHQTGCGSIGIDFNGDMIRKAEKNLENMNGGKNDSFRRDIPQNADFSYDFPGSPAFLWADAARYEVPDAVTRFYFFNPFSVRILEIVIGKVLDSWYRKPRHILLFFYYPSADYVSFLMRTDMLSFVDELDCQDLFPDDPREKILCFELI